MSSQKVVLGLLAGVAAGALAGILFAPAKGADTRKKMQQKGTNYADDLKDKLNNLSGSLKNNYEKMFQNGKGLVMDGKSKFDDAKNEIKN